MKIAVFGATGMAGSAIVTEAVSRGHTVTAVSRRSSADADHERMRWRAFDIADQTALEPVLADADAAVLAVRLPAEEHDRLAPLTRRLLDTAAHHRTRVLVIGGSAPLHSPHHPDRMVIDDPDYVPDTWKTIARASLAQYRACRDHPYNRWIYLSPPAVLQSGQRTGRYRRGTTTLLTDHAGRSRITAPDLALAVLDELEDPGTDRHITVADDVFA